MTSASQHRSAAEPRPAKKAPLQVYLPCLFILVTSKLQFFSNWGLTYICRFATIVKATKNSPLFHFFLAASNASVSTNLAATKVASNAYGAPYAKNAQICFGRFERFPTCWEISQALRITSSLCATHPAGANDVEFVFIL